MAPTKVTPLQAVLTTNICNAKQAILTRVRKQVSDGLDENVAPTSPQRPLSLVLLLSHQTLTSNDNPPSCQVPAPTLTHGQERPLPTSQGRFPIIQGNYSNKDRGDDPPWKKIRVIRGDGGKFVERFERKLSSS